MCCHYFDFWVRELGSRRVEYRLSPGVYRETPEPDNRALRYPDTPSPELYPHDDRRAGIQTLGGKARFARFLPVELRRRGGGDKEEKGGEGCEHDEECKVNGQDGRWVRVGGVMGYVSV